LPVENLAANGKMKLNCLSQLRGQPQMPYLYSAIRETCQTGLPVMRALWLHYPDDPAAVSCGDQYLYGRDILVAPVVEKGATSRRVYLPQGKWYDFWSNEMHDGGREIARDVDLATIPLYVRAGAVIPMGPLRQYTSEKIDGPLTLTVFPGADGISFLYEDDGESFDFREGKFMHLEMKWSNEARHLELRLAPGSRISSPGKLRIEIKLAGQGSTKSLIFKGQQVSIALG
jgi:alpha-glucosidase (family GH31 glycosyl hydrolase)